LQQVAWNLLMNAIKFTPEGGLVRLESRRSDSHAQIIVSDTGCGIDAKTLPHVFERFRQGDSSSTRTHRGLGLGLALVKHLVELHGGTVVAQSEGRDQGSTFIVDLPISPVPVATGTAGAAPRSATASEAPRLEVTRLYALRVLVVDDDPDALSLAKTILTASGAEVLTCETAPAAFALFREKRPDVLISDIEMPGEDGYSLIRKVRALSAEEGGKTPAIALTAYNRPQDRTRTVAAGFDMHVTKPIDPGKLTALISDVIVKVV
jgi:CheY-like chemotaxis protein